MIHFTLTVADPGFPGEGPTLEFGQKPIIYQHFWRKLHGNESNWIERGRIPNVPLDPPMPKT